MRYSDKQHDRLTKPIGSRLTLVEESWDFELAL